MFFYCFSTEIMVAFGNGSPSKYTIMNLGCEVALFFLAFIVFDSFFIEHVSSMHNLEFYLCGKNERNQKTKRLSRHES